MNRKSKSTRAFFLVAIVMTWVAVCLMTGTRRVSGAAIFTVTNTGDNGGVNPAPGAGTGTLRQAIIDANATAGADTINFQGVSGSITLAAALPAITEGLTIDGPGANGVTVSAPAGTTTIRIFDISGTITVAISGLTMANGNVTALGGTDDHGGIIRITNATVTLTNCAIINGQAGEAGGIEVNPGNLTIKGCTVAGNISTVSAGGGLLAFGPGTLSITNSTFSGNHSATTGGALELVSGGVIATIASSTFTANIATNSGGIFNLNQSLTVKGTIIAGNSGSIPDVNQFTSAGSNLIGNNTGTTITNQMPSDKVGTGAAPIDPVLGPLTDNGGQTNTHALLSGSPAIDAVADCTDVAMNPITDDQRGFARPIDGDGNGIPLCDIGAFEAPLCTSDIAPPSITCPANITVLNAANQCSAVVNYTTPTGSDICSKTTTVCSPVSGSIFLVGTTTVTCTATDGSGNSATCSFTVTVNDTQPPSITCPANITQSTDPNLCSAIVSYPAPTVSDNCPGVGAPVCSPASGSIFPKGTTTVTCTVSDAASNTSTCSFTITVNDTQPPTITCPANVTAVSAVSCPPTSSSAVTYPPPTVSDNCPGVTAACNPPSGSILPVGTTTVTCTATDTSGNTASCSFTVAVFNGRLQDDSNPQNVLLFNTTTGDYILCCGGMRFSGRGLALLKGCVFTLQHNPPDRRLLVNVDFSQNKGTASLQFPPGTIKCTIIDRNMANDTSICP